jgi:GxxExxY protein
MSSKEADLRDPQTYAIIGAAMEVHRQLGPGFLEQVYHDALAVELALQGIPFEQQVELFVFTRVINCGVSTRPILCVAELLSSS